MSDPKCEHCDREDILQELAACIERSDRVDKEHAACKAALVSTQNADGAIQDVAASRIAELEHIFRHPHVWAGIRPNGDTQCGTCGLLENDPIHARAKEDNP
jgi:uncharacterized Zn-finger protein